MRTISKNNHASRIVTVACLIAAFAIVTGCSGGPRSMSESEVADQIKKNLENEFKRSGLPIKIDGKSSMPQSSRDALDEVQKEVRSKDFFGSAERLVSVIFDARTTAPSYTQVPAREAVDNYEAFIRAQSDARNLRLRTLDIPRVPVFVKEALPAGSSFKIKATATVSFTVDSENNAVMIREILPEELDYEGLEGDFPNSMQNLVVVGSPNAMNVREEYATYIEAVQEALKLVEEEKKSQQLREVALEKAKTEAMDVFSGRYEVALTYSLDNSTDRFRFYFTGDRDGDAAIVFEPLNDNRGIRRNFRFRIPANQISHTFTEDDTPVVTIAGTARATNSFGTREAREYPQLFRVASSTAVLTMTATSGKPDEIVFSGRFSGVANKIE